MELKFNRDQTDDNYNRFIKKTTISPFYSLYNIDNLDDLKKELEYMQADDCIYEDILVFNHEMVNGEMLITRLELYPNDSDCIINDEDFEPTDDKNILVFFNYIKYEKEKDELTEWYGERIDINQYKALEDFIEDLKRRARFYCETLIMEAVKNYGEDYYFDEDWDG